MIGGGLVGTEVGLFLAEKGKEVIFVEMLDEFMNGITFDEKLVYQDRFKSLKTQVHTGKRLVGVGDNEISVLDRYGARSTIPCDSVVIAVGFRPNRELIEKLKKNTCHSGLRGGRLHPAAQDLRRDPRRASGGQAAGVVKKG